MKHRTLALVLIIIMVFSCSIAAYADEARIVVSPQNVTVDGSEIEVTAYNIDGNNYFKLRDLAVMFDGTDSQFNVTYDKEANAAIVTTYTGYTGEKDAQKFEDASASAVPSRQDIIIDGKNVAVDAWNIGGYNYFNLRDIANWLAIDVDYVAGSNTVVLESTELLSFDKASYSEINCRLDGEDIVVGMYEAVYTANPNRIEDQQIAVYVSPYASKESPIIFMVNNSGWIDDAYITRSGVVNYDGSTGIDEWTGEEITFGDYVSDSDTDVIGRAIADGYVIVSCGARSRGNEATDGQYLGHSPATMTDTKAAFRWLRLNKDALPAGDTDKIIVTGASGGGALSVVLSATGDSSDYYESLYEIGAAGVKKNEDGTYTSTISDAVWGTIAYCPITDLGNACAAYEWQWGEARAALMAEGRTSYAGATAEEVNANSAVLKEMYVEYVDSLGLDMFDSTTLEQTIIDLMHLEIKDAIKEFGVESVQTTIAESGAEDWITVNDDGTYTYDYNKHLYWAGTGYPFKIAPAFSNVGTGYGEYMNEDSLFGDVLSEYSPFNEYSWNIDSTKGNGAGIDDTGLDWDAYIATDDGIVPELHFFAP